MDSSIKYIPRRKETYLIMERGESAWEPCCNDPRNCNVCFELFENSFCEQSYYEACDSIFNEDNYGMEVDEDNYIGFIYSTKSFNNIFN